MAMSTKSGLSSRVDPALAEAHEGARLLAQRDALDHQIRQRENEALFLRRQQLSAEYERLGMRDTDPEIVAAKAAKKALNLAKENYEQCQKEWDRADGRSLQVAARQAAFRNVARQQLEESAPPEIGEAIANLQQRINDALTQQRRDVSFDPEFTTSNYSGIEQYVTAARAAICQLSPLRLLAIEPATLAKTIADILKKLPEPNFEQR